MIIYEVCATAQHVGAVLRWAGNKAEADKTLEDLLDEHGLDNVSDTTIKRMEIPTHTKEAFVRRLNVHMARVNE